VAERGALPPACAAFAEQAAELALDLVGEPARGQLLAHADGCASCRAHLDALAATGDALLALAPEAEPPPGFEGRVLDGLRQQERPAPPGRGRRWLVPTAVAAVVALLVGLGLGALLGNRGSGETSGGYAATAQAVRRAPLLTESGESRGSVILADPGEHPLVVMTLEGAEPGRTYHCELGLADGGTLEVGRWPADRTGGGVWAVSVDRAAWWATKAWLRDDQGVLVASADLYR